MDQGPIWDPGSAEYVLAKGSLAVGPRLDWPGDHLGPGPFCPRDHFGPRTIFALGPFGAGPLGLGTAELE